MQALFPLNVESVSASTPVYGRTPRKRQRGCLAEREYLSGNSMATRTAAIIGNRHNLRSSAARHQSARLREICPTPALMRDTSDNSLNGFVGSLSAFLCQRPPKIKTQRPIARINSRRSPFLRRHRSSEFSHLRRYRNVRFSREQAVDQKFGEYRQGLRFEEAAFGTSTQPSSAQVRDIQNSGRVEQNHADHRTSLTPGCTGRPRA
jgi:hypothetical protein